MAARPIAATRPEGPAEADHALVARIQSGDEQAFAILVRRYAASLCRYIVRYVRSPDITEELVQNLFFRLWQQRATWEVRQSVKAYLFSAARRHALNEHRRERLHEEWEASVLPDERTPAMSERPAAADTATDIQELHRVLRRAIDRLPPRCREAFLLTREHEMTYAEVGQVMGIAPKTVGLQVSIALRALRSQLGDWIDP